MGGPCGVAVVGGAVSVTAVAVGNVVGIVIGSAGNIGMTASVVRNDGRKVEHVRICIRLATSSVRQK